MENIQHQNPGNRQVVPGSLTLRSVTDGFSFDFIDDGQAKSGNAGPGRARILAALNKKSPHDGKAAFLVVGEPRLAQGCSAIDLERRCWTEADDKRLAEHQEIRAGRSASAAAAGIAVAFEMKKAEAEAAKQAADDERFAKIAAAVVKATQAATQAPAQAQAPAPAPAKKNG